MILFGPYPVLCSSQYDLSLPEDFKVLNDSIVISDAIDQYAYHSKCSMGAAKAQVVCGQLCCRTRLGSSV